MLQKSIITPVQCQIYDLENPGKEQKLDKIPTGDKEAKLFIAIGELPSVKILQNRIVDLF